MRIIKARNHLRNRRKVRKQPNLAINKAKIKGNRKQASTAAAEHDDKSI